jgi:cytochrome oxidase Cu insertion factor (SCO1/SenC/PrrC family)
MKKIESVFGVFLWLALVGAILIVPVLPLSADKQVQGAFLEQLKQPQAIVFFGFQHCDEICPLTLATLANLTESLGDKQQKLQVVFVDIDKNSSQTAASHFASQFHPDFIGFHPNPKQLQQLIADFGLNFTQLDSQIRHQGRIYLIDQKQPSQWYLTKALNPNTFTVSTLKKLITGV